MARSRRTKHYLLDPRFQLKWTGYLVVVVLAVMASLGVLIARMASRTSETANIAVTQAEKAFKESKVNNQLARGAVELAAPDNATLAGVMNEQLREVDAEQEKNLAEVRRLQQDIGRDKQSLQLLLVGAGVALLLLLSLMGIVITHRVVGPVHKLKRLLRRVSTGRLVVDERLRRGDELEDLFETFLQMTFSLRAMQNARVATLDATLRRAEATGASSEVVAGLRALRAQMVLGLEKRRASIHPVA
ncbi:MAG: HAMP domain-containing protein [Myxococcales bacterium]|nr:HAMP domain-containing protein [Sorangiineae bacterium PRO1]MCL4755259.1 HAMP domain-containing protein [Myxococcales bacterium]